MKRFHLFGRVQSNAWASGTKQVRRLEKQVEESLLRIDRCKFKAWLYQQALLPRLIWPLMLYEVPSTTVEALERITSRHLRKWLGVPPSFSSIGLYGKNQ